MSVAVRVADALPIWGAVLFISDSSVPAVGAPATPALLPSDGDGLPAGFYQINMKLFHIRRPDDAST